MIKYHNFDKQVPFTKSGTARKKPISVKYSIAAQKGCIKTLWGDVLNYEPGDFIIEGNNNDKWCVKKEVFLETYNFDSNTQQAIKKDIPVDFMVASYSGVLTSTEAKEQSFTSGDYIMRNHKGNLWPIAQAVFKQTYTIDDIAIAMPNKP